MMKNALKKITDQIADACLRSGRTPEEVKIIPVSKSFPAETILQAYEQGIKIFAENKAQEFRDKTRVLPQDIEWHFIGALQTNKIKYVVPKAALLHSVDSLHLAEAVSKFAQRKNVTASVLLEVNTSAEKSKIGVTPEQAEETFLEILELNGLKLKGLMTMAPFTDDERLVRNSFRQLRSLQQKLQKHTAAENIKELSMGMSSDFVWAVEEGSTMVRIGTAIFGARGR